MKINTGLAAWAVCAAASLAALPAHAQSDLDAYKAKCAAYGFAPGSAELAQCVQKLDAQQQPHFDCANIAQQQRYYCGGEGSEKGGRMYGAMQCGTYTDSFNAHCQ